MRGVPRDSAGDLPGAVAVDRRRRGCRAARSTIASQLVGVVVVEPGDEPEAVAQRAGDHAGAGGGADERERRHRQADARRRRALADDDVELEVLHRRVEDLLDGARQPVDLVDEQHVAVLELGEDRGQVAGPLERRARRDVQVDAHLGGDDAGQRGLAEPGRAGEQQVVDRLARVGGPPRARSRRCSLSSRWPTNSSSARGRSPASSSTSDSITSSSADRCRGRGTRHARRAPSDFSASRSSVAASASERQLAQHVADLVGAVAEAGQRLAHVGDRRRRPAGDRRRRRAPAPSSRSRSSTSRRSAVFLPTPGTSVSAATSLLATMSTSAAGGWVARIAIASAGPTPWVAISTWNVCALVA